MSLGNPAICKAGSVFWIIFLTLPSLNISMAWPLLEIFKNRFNIYSQLYLACVILAHGINRFLGSLPALFLGWLWLWLYYNTLCKNITLCVTYAACEAVCSSWTPPQAGHLWPFPVYIVECPPTQIASFMPAVQLSFSCFFSFWMSSYAFQFSKSASYLPGSLTSSCKMSCRSVW